MTATATKVNKGSSKKATGKKGQSPKATGASKAPAKGKALNTGKPADKGAKASDKTDKANPKTATPPKEKKLSMNAAALIVLKASKTPMSCKEIVTAMAEKKLWVSQNGKTPERTLSADLDRSIAKDIANKAEPRFVKVDRGRYIAG